MSKRGKRTRVKPSKAAPLENAPQWRKENHTPTLGPCSKRQGLPHVLSSEVPHLIESPPRKCVFCHRRYDVLKAEAPNAY